MGWRRGGWDLFGGLCIFIVVFFVSFGQWDFVVAVLVDGTFFNGVAPLVVYLFFPRLAFSNCHLLSDRVVIVCSCSTVDPLGRFFNNSGLNTISSAVNSFGLGAEYDVALFILLFLIGADETMVTLARLIIASIKIIVAVLVLAVLDGAEDLRLSNDSLEYAPDDGDGRCFWGALQGSDPSPVSECASWT